MLVNNTDTICHKTSMQTSTRRKRRKFEPLVLIWLEVFGVTRALNNMEIISEITKKNIFLQFLSLVQM